MTFLKNQRTWRVTALAFVLPMATAFVTGCASMRNDEKPITEIPKDVPAEGYKPSSQYSEISLDQNKLVDQWIKYFTGRGRKYMHIYLERSARYIPMMKATFRERGMPDDLAYIAMIESGFSPTAFSHASAVGYWQFIRSTGKRYNLRIDTFVDERRDPILSTQSAATYLDSLYSLFGDWHLALAAYNVGEGRVQRAVMKYRTRNFWELASKRRALPRETDNYIPKYIAAVMIAKDPAKYGFVDINFQPAFSFESVVIDKPISLETLSKEISVDYEELKRMNPRYKSDYVPVYTDRVNAVRVPIEKKDLAVASIPKCLSDAPKIYVAEFDYYRVKRGDTLSHIARRFRTSIARLRDLNDFSRRTMIRVGQKIKVPDQNAYIVKNESAVKKNSQVTEQSEREVANTSSPSNQSSLSKSLTPSQIKARKHVVRRGENLSTIAKKYRTTVALLTQVNNLSHRSKLFVGTKLLIPN